MKLSTLQQFGLLIDGQIRPSKSNRFFDVINPSNGEVLAQVADASLEDVHTAIASAKQAFESGVWSNLNLEQRGEYLLKIAQTIREHAKELADLECLSTGKTIKQTTFIDVPTSAETFEYYSKVRHDFHHHDNPVPAPVKSRTVFEPMGVVSAIIPWNYPLIMFAWKVAPALMAGNSVIFKPSRLGCLSILRLAQLIKSIGLPKGVLNIVFATDSAAASELIAHKDINMVTFTGGTETGQEVMRLASKTTKKLSLELGGKSPNIVFADCDMETAIGGTMSAIFMNQGQMCTAASRLLLEDKIYDQFLTRLVEKTKNLKIGEANDHSTDFGPLISEQQRLKVLGCVQKAIKDGAKLLCGGEIVAGKGFYFQPTILGDVKNSMTVAQEEVFGPVLSVIKFSSEEEAIKIANDSKYGLAACIWTKDKTKAERVAHKLEVGTVWINTYGGFYNEASFGGYKQSGFGRELGIEGLKEFTQSKHICMDATPGGAPLAASWF